jgi:4-hydroxybenzoate polyprenyltransferase
MGYLSGSRRKLPIYFIGIIVFGLIATGYLDKYPLLILLFVILLVVVYLKIKPFEGTPDEMQKYPS